MHCYNLYAGLLQRTDNRQESIFKAILFLIYLNCILLTVKKSNLFVWIEASSLDLKQDHINQIRKYLNKDFAKIYVIDPWVLSQASIFCQGKVKSVIFVREWKIKRFEILNSKYKGTKLKPFNIL